MQPTISNKIFAYLSSLGVDRVFLVPGGGNMFLVDAAGSETGIEFVPTHHEQAAVIAAEYYARRTGRLGVALVTTGPGSTNAITGISGAWLDSIPVLILAGQVKTADYNFDQDLRQKGPQEIDLVSMVKNVTKFAKTCFDADTVLDDVMNAVKAALGGRPGPAVLEVPLDVQSRINDAEISASQDDGQADEPELQLRLETCVSDIVEALREAERPVIISGFGVKCAGQSDNLRQLIEAEDLPVALTWPMADFLPFDHRLNCGRFGVVAKRHPNMILQKADFVLVLGSRLDNIQTAFNADRFARQAKTFVVDIDTAELRKMPEKVTTYHLDLSALVPMLSSRLKGSGVPASRRAWLDDIDRIRTKFSRETFAYLGAGDEDLSIYDFMEALSDAFTGGETIVTGSSGLAIEVFYTHFRNLPGQWIALTTGLGSMGYGLPALLGASAADPGKCFLFESDGSMMMNLQELQSLKTLGKPLTIFVQNNGGYASIRATQENYFESRFVGTGSTSKLDVPDFEKVAASFGFDFMRITADTDIASALKAAVEADGQLLVDVVLRKDEKLMPKCGVTRLPNNQLVSQPLEDMTPLLPIEELRDAIGDNVDAASLTLRQMD